MATVLVVEDESSHFRLLEITLRKEGYDVIEAQSLITAYEKTIDLAEEEASSLPNIIIVDLRFGKDEMAGLRFAWAIRGCPLTARIPLIITTATANEALRHRLTSPYFPFPVIEKPFPPFRMAQLIKQMLEETDKPQGAD